MIAQVQNIAGRGGQITAEFRVSAAAVTIRIDDGRREDFWCELRLTPFELRELALECERAEVEGVR